VHCSLSGWWHKRLIDYCIHSHWLALPDVLNESTDCSILLSCALFIVDTESYVYQRACMAVLFYKYYRQRASNGSKWLEGIRDVKELDKLDKLDKSYK
jgi:hypothetical protein